MVACWNWIRDFVYKHCNSSYRQSQCANNKNTHNRTWIAKSQNESTEYCSRTTSTFRRYSNRFSIFLETHIFPNRFNYLWSVFCTIPVICLFLSLSFVVRIWLLMTSENCLLFSHVRSSDTFLTKEENYVSIIITSNVIIILYLWNTRP